MELSIIIDQIKQIAYKLEHDRFMPRDKRKQLLYTLDELMTKRKLLEVQQLKQYAQLADILDKRGMHVLANEVDELLKYSAEMGKLIDMDAFKHKKMMKERFKDREGTVVSGTFQEPVLIDAFMKELETLDPNKALKIYEEYSPLFIDLNDRNYENIDQGELHDLLYDTIMPTLSRLAPNGMYFGSHPNDGSDFGWWQEDFESAADDVTPFPSPIRSIPQQEGVTNPDISPRPAISSEFVKAYIEAALWSSMDDDSVPLDANYSIDDIDAKTLKEMIRDCKNFQSANKELLDQYYEEGFTEGEAGHDFWLTRNGHGAGFWDRGSRVGDALTSETKPHGSFDLYVSDGKIYGQ